MVDICLPDSSVDWKRKLEVEARSQKHLVILVFRIITYLDRHYMFFECLDCIIAAVQASPFLTISCPRHVNEWDRSCLCSDSKVRQSSSSDLTE